jgi:hypothetical protein
MSDQQVKYTITADASQANSELAKVDKAAASLVNQERALADSIARASRTLAAEEKAAAAAAKAIADHGAESVKAEKAVAAHERAVAQSAKAMLAQQRATENLAAATKKAADEAAKAASGTRNVGQAALEASRGIEDLQYGIGGVVNNIPSLVMALGGGAGLTAAISLAAVAANQLTGKLTDYIKKQQQASQAAIKGRLSLLDMRVSTMQETADLQLELDRLTAEISGGTNKVTEDASKKRLADLQSNITNAQEDIVKREGTLQMLDRIKFRSGDQDEQINATKAYIRDRRNRINADNVAIEQELKNQEIRIKIAKAEKQLEDKGQKGRKVEEIRDYSPTMEEKASFGAGFKGETLLASILESTAKMQAEADAMERKAAEEQAKSLLNTEEKMLSWVAKMGEEARDHKKENDKKAESAKQLHLSRLEDLEGESLAARMAFDTLAMDHKMENLDKLKAYEFKNLKDTAKQYESMYNDLGALAEGATSTLIGASQDYFKAKIEGAENAEALAAAAFLSGVGEQLVGLGTKNLFEGAGMLIASGGVDPRGYALTALGAGAIAAGVGMGAGSAAISHTAAGGTIGKEMPDDKKAAKDKGASPGRGGSGSGGGGPLVVNVAYGAGGPLPEDTAREIQKAVDTGRRRGGR